MSKNGQFIKEAEGFIKNLHHKCYRKTPLGRPRCKLKDNTKMDFKRHSVKLHLNFKQL